MSEIDLDFSLEITGFETPEIDLLISSNEELESTDKEEFENNQKKQKSLQSERMSATTNASFVVP